MSAIINVESDIFKYSLKVIDEKYVKLNFYEDFFEPSEYTELFYKLEDLTNKYDLIIVDINSNGGYTSTLIHLYNILRRFKTMITVNSADAYSAGFMLWLLGDYRFAYDYSSFMYHRESFFNWGKTSEHKRYAEHNEKRISKFILDKVKEVLTDKEMELGETTEVWLTGEELIKRGVCQNYDELDINKYVIDKVEYFKISDNLIAELEDDKYVIYEIKKKEETNNFKKLIELKDQSIISDKGNVESETE